MKKEITEDKLSHSLFEKSVLTLSPNGGKLETIDDIIRLCMLLMAHAESFNISGSLKKHGVLQTVNNMIDLFQRDTDVNIEFHLFVCNTLPLIIDNVILLINTSKSVFEKSKNCFKNRKS